MTVADVANVVGIAGVFIITLMYLLLQTDRVNPDKVAFSILNGAGALMIIFSLWFHWNLPSVIMEGFWLVISVYGIVKALLRGQSPAAE